MNKHILVTIFTFFYGFSATCQSIVNTEKLFNDTEDGFATAAELMGSAISGNANVLLVEYSMNFRYRWKKTKGFINFRVSKIMWLLKWNKRYKFSSLR